MTPASKTLWIDPSFGASGDMFLGALSDLLGSTDALLSGLAGLGIKGYSITSETVTRNGISAHRVEVSTATTSKARHWSDIDALLTKVDLPPRVRDGARSTFRRLGVVEAEQHKVDLEQVHFHEVGAVDAIVDIVGSWILLDQLGIDRVVVGPVGLGHGTVEAAHGTLPLPAPATAALLKGMAVHALDTPTETCTPTGAALLRQLAVASSPNDLPVIGPLPAGTIIGVSRGAGGRDSATYPNVLTLMLLDTEPEHSSSTSPSGSETSIMLATNIDDVSPEILAHTVHLLLEAGADDAWLVPIVMKKGRPAHELRVLTSQALAGMFRSLIHRQTGTLGIREYSVTKHVLPRESIDVTLRAQVISMKIGPHGAKPEHDDLVRLSDTTGVPIRILAQEARDAFDDLTAATRSKQQD